MDSRTGRRRTSSDVVQLPSGTTLEYTLIQPNHPPSNGAPANVQGGKLAICLHPWSWLGGRMDDPVLQLLTVPLLERGYDVLRYNSRGVGKSTGWASFTGSREAEDLKEFVQWAKGTSCRNIGSLVLVGYSYGSLIASLHPTLEDVNTSHILLSYPIGPRHWLTAFHAHRYTSALESLVQHPRSNVLIVYGDQDNFTSVETYDSWIASLRSHAAGTPSRGSEDTSGKLHITKVEGASHFWREEEAANQLYELVRDWLP